MTDGDMALALLAGCEQRHLGALDVVDVAVEDDVELSLPLLTCRIGRPLAAASAAAKSLKKQLENAVRTGAARGLNTKLRHGTNFPL